MECEGQGGRARKDHPRLDYEGFLHHVLGLDCVLPAREMQAAGSEPRRSACNGNGACELGSPQGGEAPGSRRSHPTESKPRARSNVVGTEEGEGAGVGHLRRQMAPVKVPAWTKGGSLLFE